MPTPFTHLEIAQRLLVDEALPAADRLLLGGDDASRAAFLLGSIAPDARVSTGLNREATHFYRYDLPIDPPVWRIMLRHYPAVAALHTAAARAFVAGYVAHLAVDEHWSLALVRPHFAFADWSTRDDRFFLLNILLIAADQRDYGRLAAWQRPALLAAEPDAWLPFIPDADLGAWRDLVGVQLQPGGESQTLAIIGERVGRTAGALAAVLGDAAMMQRRLWSHVPPEAVAQVEADMYAHARAEVAAFLALTPA